MRCLGRNSGPKPGPNRIRRLDSSTDTLDWTPWTLFSWLFNWLCVFSLLFSTFSTISSQCSSFQSCVFFFLSAPLNCQTARAAPSRPFPVRILHNSNIHHPVQPLPSPVLILPMRSLYAQPAPLAISRLSNGLHFSSRDDPRPASPCPTTDHHHHHLANNNKHPQPVIDSSTLAFFTHLIEQTSAASPARNPPASNDDHQIPAELAPSSISDTASVSSFSLYNSVYANAAAAPDLVLLEFKPPRSSDHKATPPFPPQTAPPGPPRPGTYRSLIPKLETGAGPADKKQPRRVRSSRNQKLASSASSLRSTVSSLFSTATARHPYSSKRKTVLLDLPVELLDDVMAHLDQRSLLALMTVARPVSALAVRHLYFEPLLTTSYRLAQFVTTVTHNLDLALFVKVLDLSKIKWATRKDTGEVLAGWRDWKLRNNPLSHVKPSFEHQLQHQQQHQQVPTAQRRQRSLSRDRADQRGAPATTQRSRGGANGFKKYSRFSRSSGDLVYVGSSSSTSTSTPVTPSRQAKRKSTVPAATPRPAPTPPYAKLLPPPPPKPPVSSHPLQSFLLRQFASARDVPVGSLLHLFKVCQNLLIVDISRVQLAMDYFVNSTAAGGNQEYPVTALSGYLFVSDVPSVPRRSALSMVLYSQVVDALSDLLRLKSLTLSSATWLTKDLVRRLLTRCGCRLSGESDSDNTATTCLEHLDLRDSGLARDLEWACEGSVHDVWAVFEREEAALRRMREDDARGILPFRRA